MPNAAIKAAVPYFQWDYLDDRQQQNNNNHNYNEKGTIVDNYAEKEIPNLDIFANSLLRSLVVKYINKVFGALASKYNMKLNKLKTSDLPIEEMVTYGQCVFTVTISNRKPSGKAWDAFNGAPDPFGTLIIQGKTYPITKRNNSHVISFTFTNMRSRLSMFKVSLMDKDVSNNDYIGNESFIWDGSKQGNMKQNSLSFSWHCVQ